MARTVKLWACMQTKNNGSKNKRKQFTTKHPANTLA